MLTKDELLKLDAKKLEEEAYKSKKELFNLEYSLRTSSSKENHKRNLLKRYIARVKTIRQQKNSKPSETTKTIEKAKEPSKPTN